MENELKGLYTNLLGIHLLAFGEAYEGKEDVLELALVIRNGLKGRFDVSRYIRNRFNLVMQEMGCVDFRLSEQFYAKCV